MKRLIITESEKNHILSLYNINEALPPSQFRPYVKEFNRERYSDIFKTLGDKYDHDRNYYRIYIPLVEEKKEGPVSEVQKEIEDFLKQNGYQVLDYVKGIAKFGESKNTTTIGKALTRLKADELMKKFVSDESRKALTSDTGGLMVVISRHPYDIAGSDTDRNWTNCMTMGQSESPRVEKLKKEYEELAKKYSYVSKDELRKKNVERMNRGEYIDFEEEMKKFNSIVDPPDNVIKKLNDLRKEIENRKEQGQNVKYIIHDVKSGSLISYLINKNDRDIKNPLAVLNIKPYIKNNDIRKENDFILVSDSEMYGQGRPEFKSTVDGILDEINGPDKQGMYCLRGELYADNNKTTVYKYDKKTIDPMKQRLESFFHKNIDQIVEKNYKSLEDIIVQDFYDDLESYNADEEYIEKSVKEFENELSKEKNNLFNKYKNCILESIKENDLLTGEWIADNLNYYQKIGHSGDKFSEEKFFEWVSNALEDDTCQEEIRGEVIGITYQYLEQIENKDLIELNLLKNLNRELLNEASKIDILKNKLGFNDDIAQKLDKATGPLSVIIGNKLIEHEFNYLTNFAGGAFSDIFKMDNAIDRLNKEEVFTSLYLPKINIIMEWIKIGLNGNLGDYKNLNFKELSDKSKEWYDSLNLGTAEINYVEKNPIILDFRDEDGVGFYWVDLQTNNSAQECERMGHCGKTAHGNRLYSLREFKNIGGEGKYKMNKSHLTASISSEGTLRQLKGPKNSKPDESYHKYIVPLFFVQGGGNKKGQKFYLITNIGSEYESEKDFKISDLPDSTIKTIYDKRPELFKKK